MSPFKVIIVGGGLAGSLLANGLINNNVDVTVYERDVEHSKREGYQIRLGEYSLNGFRACLSPAHLATIEQKFGLSSAPNEQTPYTAPSIYSTRFKPVFDLGKFPSYSISTAINRVVLRKFLIDPVRDHGNVRFNKNFSYYEIVHNQNSEEKIRVHFADGTSDTCDVLIGADGSGSKINDLLGLKNLVEINTHWGFVAKGSLPPERLQKLPRRLQNGPTLTFHDGATLYYALYLPAKKEVGTESNVLFNYDHAEASFYWSFVIPKKHSRYDHESQIPDHLKFCLDYVKDWAPEYQSMLSIGKDDIDSAGVSVIPLRASIKPSKRWRDDLQRKLPKGSDLAGHPRVWLIGDSIHAMQPNRGMGGNQSMYDCVDLLPQLLELNTLSKSQSSVSTEQVRAAVERYENKMMDRAFKWVQKSGGTSVPNVNFNGLLGFLLSMINTVVLPIISAIGHLLYRPKKKSE